MQWEGLGSVNLEITLNGNMISKLGALIRNGRSQKLFKKYGMSRICDNFFEFDCFCNISAYWMCDDGLSRNANQINKGQMNAVYPYLHGVSNAYVSKKLTNVVRLSLQGASHEIRKKFSAK